MPQLKTQTMQNMTNITRNANYKQVMNKTLKIKLMQVNKKLTLLVTFLTQTDVV